MKITSQLFAAFLKCPTKCYLRSQAEIGFGNDYAGWVRAQDESYEREAARRLQETLSETGHVVASPDDESLKTAQWRWAENPMARTPGRSADSHVRESQPNEDARGLGGPRSGLKLESRLHTIERVPSEGRGKAAQFIPIRFVWRTKLTQDDRLQLAFDALVLSEMLGREVSLGKIIHGDDHATLKVKLGARTAESARTKAKPNGLLAEAAKRIEKIEILPAGEPNARSADRHVRESQPNEETRGLGGPRSGPHSVRASPAT